MDGSFVPYLGAVWTLIWPVAEVNKWERGLGPSETEIFRSEDWNLLHQTLSVNRGSTKFDVCERLVTAPGRCCSRRHEKLSNIVWT